MHFAATEKWQKVKRAHHALKFLYSDQPRGIDNTEAKDAVESFFNQCYHLKDWLIKDKSVGVISDLERYIKNCKGLSLAADICNSLKHGGLDRKSRSGSNLDEMLVHLKVDPPTQVNRHWLSSSRVEVIFDGRKEDALALADLCMSEWKAFFKRDSITLSDP